VKILLLVDRFPPDQIGGIWETAHQLRLAFERQGHSVFVLTNGNPSSVDDVNQIKRTGRGLFVGSCLIMLKLCRFCRENAIDVIHAHQPLSSPALLFIKLFNRKVRLLTTFQTTYFSEFKSVTKRKIGQKFYFPSLIEYLQKYIFAPFHILLDFVSYLVADEVTAVSSEVKNQLQSSYGIFCHKPVSIIPNGAPIIINQAENQKKLRVIFFAGAFRIRKGIWELLHAFKEMDQKDLDLVIAGNGRGYDRALLSEIKLLGIEGRVRMLGKISNKEIIDWLSRSEVFCLPSSMEGLPLVLLEAMSVGAAIVATSITGVNEVIQDNVNGILVPPGDISKLRYALNRVVSQPELRAQLGQAARSTVEKKYQWDSIADIYLRLMELGKLT
jgi:glycosyltransferase involved in cell wall biosynthesis